MPLSVKNKKTKPIQSKSKPKPIEEHADDHQRNTFERLKEWVRGGMDQLTVVGKTQRKQTEDMPTG